MADSHTATQLEPYFLDALRDGTPHRIREVYSSVERSGLLSGEDYLRIPTTEGYKRLKALGIDVKLHSKSARELHTLVEIHGLPSEPHFQNRVRYARRQLLKKGHITAPQTDFVQITDAGQERAVNLSKSSSSDPPENLPPIPYLTPNEGEPTADDGPTTVLRSIRVRRGQTKFRNLLRSRYGDQCMMSGEPLLDVLEAAHIRAVADGGSHKPDNGLLLRADLHTLFDLDLIGVHPADLSIHLHASLRGTGYEPLLKGQCLQVNHGLMPNRDALRKRWARFLRRGGMETNAV